MTSLSYVAYHHHVLSGVAMIWCEEGHETKRKQFKGDTQKYYEIHAINNARAITLSLYIFTGYRQPHGVECQSLCSSEVT